ncbi:hypothetical protein [Devriesea agamarum]|uniref:hypothetical protein n=1 Tax=Devriesea agamarum TaxID=472569 RepID=UPI00071D375D|nr:hypothetical protein [Devriesea agamarum]
MHRRSFFQTAGICGLALTVPSVAYAADTPVSLGFMDTPEDPTKQLETIVGRLDALPADLKKADPKSYPNYEEKLRAHLGDLKVVTPPQPRLFSTPLGNTVMVTNPVKCAFSVVSVVVKFGISVIKIIQWIVQAFKKYGGIKGVWEALRSGKLSIDFGKEAEKVLNEIMGIQQVVEACM